MHHKDGRLFVIDLQSVCSHSSCLSEAVAHSTLACHALYGKKSWMLLNLSLLQTQGTFLDSKRLQPNKPKQLADGSVLTFGTSSVRYVVKCDSAGVIKLCLPNRYPDLM